MASVASGVTIQLRLEKEISRPGVYRLSVFFYPAGDKYPYSSHDETGDKPTKIASSTLDELLLS